jgi:hypothetical protein
MKYVIYIMAVVLFGWPALIVGYICWVIVSGFKAGTFICERHEDAAIDKFTKKPEIEV